MSKEDIKKVILEVIQSDPQKGNIQSLSLFGSFLHGDYSNSSDVDLLIELKESTGFFTLMALQNRLEDTIGRPVQLLTKNSISRHFRLDVTREAERIL